MSSEPLHLIDPRGTVQLQGFSGRAATTTLHDTTATGFRVSGILQAAWDFANVQIFSAHDYGLSRQVATRRRPRGNRTYGQIDACPKLHSGCATWDMSRRSMQSPRCR